MADFQAEIPLYLHTQKLIDNLQNLKLNGSVNQMLMQVYLALIKQGFINKDELVILKQWLKELKAMQL